MHQGNVTFADFSDFSEKHKYAEQQPVD